MRRSSDTDLHAKLSGRKRLRTEPGPLAQIEARRANRASMQDAGLTWVTKNGGVYAEYKHNLREKKAAAFASANGYDLRDYIKGGMVPDWWDFTWMILAEKRGLRTPHNRDLAWRRYEENLLSKKAVVGSIRPR